MSAEQDLAAHYHHGGLEQALVSALKAAGKDPDRLVPGDMMGADEFHIGGAQATRDLAAQLALTPDMHLLDIGSGLGGPARHLAQAYGCRVTGIDLSEEYVAVATSLTRRMGLSARVAFQHASAAGLPFADGSFDGALLLHVGMNIADKAGLFADVRRTLRRGGFIAVYDVMRTAAGALDFPVPWSSMAATSFVEPPEIYRAALTQAGFTMVAERNRATFARDLFAALRARQERSGPPPIGLQIVWGPTASQKTANLIGQLERGVIAPVEMIARR